MKPLRTLVLFSLALPALPQNFVLQLTGGNVTFGKGAPIHITVTPSTMNGKVAPGTPPPVILAGSSPFQIIGTTHQFGQPWEVEFVFPGPPFANQGDLAPTSISWELTGKYSIVLRNTVKHAECAQTVAMSGEYQLAGPPLSGGPHDPKKPAKSPGQSPGLAGVINLKGHASIFPTFLSSATCPAAVAAKWNALIGKQGLDTAAFRYKLTY